MYMRLIGNDFTEEILKQVGEVTNQAKLHIRNVAFNKKDGILHLPIDRYRITRKIRPVLFASSYGHDLSVRIPSLIIVRNVLDCIIEDNSPPHSNEITLLFGLTIKGQRIFAGSVEEGVGRNRGLTWYGIDITVSDIDLEIRDNSGRGEVQENGAT